MIKIIIIMRDIDGRNYRTYAYIVLMRNEIGVRIK